MIRARTKRTNGKKAWAFGLLLAALAATMVFTADPARAATFNVNSTADKVDDGLGDDFCATGPFQVGIEPECTLRAAIQEANALAGADVIVVPAGTYELTITGSGEDSSATGDLDIRDGVSITGAGARQTIIDGGGIDRTLHVPTIGGAVNPFTVNITDVKITGGASANGAGGGIAQFSRGSDLNLTESTVSGNSATQAGGIHVGAEPSFGGTTTINRSTISGNETSTQGGGIQIQTTLMLANSTVSGNESNIGGGIMNGGTLKVTDSTIAFNTAQNNSGGIYASSGATLNNTIVANNRSVEGSNSNNCSDPLTSEGKNLENGMSCGFNQSGDKNANPRLGPLRNNGGPTNTHALMGASPAIDAGGMPAPATDQRGVLRPQRTANDIGAFERVNSPPVAQNDAYDAREDRTLGVGGRGILRNDVDPEGDPLTATLVSGPGKGSLTLRPDGSFTYKPKKNFNGRDSFVYEASDGNGGADRATVAIEVRAAPG